jgi:hypothetical protein
MKRWVGLGVIGDNRPRQYRPRNGKAARPVGRPRELSQDFKYIALARIPEFESSHPSHAVGLELEYLTAA